MKILLLNLLLKYTKCSCDYKRRDDFIGMDMARKFLEMGFTSASRYANHSPVEGSTIKCLVKSDPCEQDWRTNTKAKSAADFKEVRDKAAYDPEYQHMRRSWRENE